MAGKSLVIVESSAKARTIQRYLGGGYVIEASSGHVMDLPKKELGVDIDDHFKPRYVVIPGKAKIVNRLKKLASGAERVYLALDPDREGEAIAWFLAERLGLSPESARRVLFFEITLDAVRRAMESPGRVDMKKVNAQQARRILDRLVGYQVSPILWGPFKPGISAGRVQTVALRLICDREKEIDAFESEEYWSITAFLKTAGGEDLEARLVKIGGKDPAIPDQKAADRIAAEIAPGPFRIGTIESRSRKKNPPPPFITSTLQQEASRRLGFPASRTMSVAQSLYEGVDLEGERRAGLITYMRTDSVRMAPSAVEDARAWIGERHGADYLPDKPRGYKSKRRVQDAHEAIRPTSVRRTPESVAKYLNRDQARLYELIWKRFVACQMNPAVFDVTSVDIPVGDYLLRATGSVLRFPGYLVLAGRDAKSGNGGDEERLLPVGLTEGDALALDRMEPRQHFTQPPPRYSEGTLIKELESRDIGRPSTYATIVRTLKTRKYIRIEKKKFVPSFLGRAVNEVLTRSFPVIFEVEFTRRMESELDRVENGEMEWQEVLSGFYGHFRESLDAGEKAGKEILENYLKEITSPEDWTCPRCGRDMVVKWSGDEAFLGCSGYPECQQTKPLDGGESAEVDRECPKCGKPLHVKRGRYGPFLACTGYPECNHTEPLEGEGNGDGGEGASPPVEEKCELCGADMVLKRGRFGRFLACTRYPECKGTRSIPIGVPCPKEGCDGGLVERQGRKGKLFFGCSRYPDCRFTTWNRPRAAQCPSCGFGFAAVSGRGRPVSCKCLKCGETFAGTEEAPVKRS